MTVQRMQEMFSQMVVKKDISQSHIDFEFVPK